MQESFFIKVSTFQLEVIFIPDEMQVAEQTNDCWASK